MGSLTGEERTAAVIRVLVVLAVGLALLIGPELARGRVTAATALVAGALAYSVVVVVLEWRDRRLRPSWLITTVDAALALAACALTGAAESIMVATLPLVVIAAGVRGGTVPGRLASVGVGAAFTVVAVLASDDAVPLAQRWLAGAWWTGFLVAIAVLVGVLVRTLERQLDAAAAVRTQLAAQDARIDGVRVVLHEFRTPVASLTALTTDLAADRLHGAARPAAVGLLAEHAVHLRDMLDGLADVAIRDGSPLGRVRERPVPLAELAEAVLDAAGVAPQRRRAVVDPPDATVCCDPQRLRRVLTNLAENAARHSGAAPVELDLRHADERLVVQVRDRGPGLPPGQQGLVTAKGVAVGERAGTAGLGLWIVDQIVTAMGGTLALLPRDGGGLVASLELPVPGRDQSGGST
ncbi:MAG: sensor histidine kinase [Pseudonocardia sp.]